MRATARWPGWPANSAPLVLLAHHRGDQAETVLLRLLRGTGLAGMVAMAPLSRRDEVDYLRPWLDQDRDDIPSLRRLRGGHRLARGAGPDQFRSPHPRGAARVAGAGAGRAGLAGAASWRGMRPWPRPRRSWTKWRARISPRWSRARTAPAFAARVARAVASAAGAGVALVAGRQWRAHAFGSAHARPVAPAARPAQPGHDRQLRVEQAGHAIRCHRGRVWLERR